MLGHVRLKGKYTDATLTPWVEIERSIGFDRHGTIYRQLYGVDIETQAFVEPLKELVFDTPRSAGLIEHWLSTFKLFCTVYDPNRDRYRFDYSIFTMIVVGLLCLGSIATFIVHEWRSAR